MPDRQGFRRELGRRIAAQRRYRELSQPGLSEATGLTKSSISRWERGEAPIDVEALLAIADILQVAVTSLIPPADPTLGRSLTWPLEGEAAS